MANDTFDLISQALHKIIEIYDVIYFMDDKTDDILTNQDFIGSQIQSMDTKLDAILQGGQSQEEPEYPQSGETYYVEPGDNLNNDINNIIAGDTVIVRDGIFHQNMEMWQSGEPGNWIRIQSESLYSSKLSGSSQFGIELKDGVHHIIFDGFEISNFNYGGIWLNHNCHDIVLKNCHIHHIANEIIEGEYGRVGIMTKKTNQNIKIENNVINHIGRLPHEENPNPEDPNYPHDYKHDHGIYAQGSGILIKENIIADCFAGWGIKVDGNDISDTERSHTIINNQFLQGTNPIRDGHIRFFTNRSKCEYSSQDVIIEDNTFSECPNGYAISDNQEQEGTITHNVIACPNVINDETNKTIIDNLMIGG